MADADQERLTALFEKLGARDPDDWARSQIEEGIPQLERFLFLRQARRQIVPADADVAAGHWQLQIPEFEKLVGVGASPADLVALIRRVQRDLLFSLCFLMDDPGLEEVELEDMDWGLFKIDADGRPGVRINGLHESVIETDPEGRE